jgi:hypothetical protein
MPAMPNSLLAVVERFPGQEDKLKWLFEQSASFQSLCEDHMMCAEALRHWNQSTSADAPARREEYAKLLQDLEAEIVESLLEAR